MPLMQAPPPFWIRHAEAIIVALMLGMAVLAMVCRYSTTP